MATVVATSGCKLAERRPRSQPAASATPSRGGISRRRQRPVRVGSGEPGRAAAQPVVVAAAAAPETGGSGGGGVGPLHLGNDHLLPAHVGDDLGTHGGTANGNGKLHHLPSSLFQAFPKLPPEGSTLTPEEQRCDPEVERCRTPIHVWESRCSACAGSGSARSFSSHGKHRLVSVCLLCHGLGYVRHSSTHVDTVPYVNGTGPHTTIGRPPAPERKPPRQWQMPGGLKQQQQQQQQPGQP